MALPMTMIVLTGEIDLSVASMLGLGASVFGYAFAHHTGIVGAMAIALAVGALGGALNGFLVAQLGLPSIAVTIGTLTMFRGIAEVILGQNEVTGFPTSLTNIGIEPIFLHIAYPFFFFVVLAAIYGVVVHKTAFGRSLFAIGLNTEAAFFSGIRVKRTKFLLYVVSGVICAATGIIYSLQSSSSIYTAGTGLELNVVAVVLFGGVSIFGGRGTVLGVVLSAVIIGLTEVAFTLINISAQEQQVIFGVPAAAERRRPQRRRDLPPRAWPRAPRQRAGERRGRLMNLPPAASRFIAASKQRWSAHAPPPSGRNTSTTMEERKVKFHQISRARAVIGLAALRLPRRLWRGRRGHAAHSIKKGLLVYAIPKDTINPYEVIADNGIKKAHRQRSAARWS